MWSNPVWDTKKLSGFKRLRAVLNPLGLFFNIEIPERIDSRVAHLISRGQRVLFAGNMGGEAPHIVLVEKVENGVVTYSDPNPNVVDPVTKDATAFFAQKCGDIAYFDPTPAPLNASNHAAIKSIVEGLNANGDKEGAVAVLFQYRKAYASHRDEYLELIDLAVK
jgi:hypothetical protein